MQNVRHISFATPDYSRAARQLRQSTKRFGLSTFIYTVDHPVLARLRAECPEIMMRPRGAGNWLWKPAIILDALKRSQEDSILLYTDAGMHMIADPEPLFAHALDRPIVLFEHAHKDGAPPHPQGKWTKRDAFVLLDADRPEFWSSQQLTGGFQLYRNCPKSREFVAEVLAACSDPRVLTDIENTQGLANLDDFAAHRHDQSVLTIVADRHGIPRLPDPSQFGGEGPTQFFYLHRKSDHSVFTKLRGYIWGIDTGEWDRPMLSREIGARRI